MLFRVQMAVWNEIALAAISALLQTHPKAIMRRSGYYIHPKFKEIS